MHGRNRFHLSHHSGCCTISVSAAWAQSDISSRLAFRRRFTLDRNLRRDATSIADSDAKEMITARAGDAFDSGQIAGDQSSGDAFELENSCNRSYGRMLAAGNPKHDSIHYQ